MGKNRRHREPAEPKGRVLCQAMAPEDNPENERIIRAALKSKEGKTRPFSTYIKGLSCPCCGSRKTKTEFYRLSAWERPSVGVTACDDCGAC